MSFSPLKPFWTTVSITCCFSGIITGRGGLSGASLGARLRWHLSSLNQLRLASSWRMFAQRLLLTNPTWGEDYESSGRPKILIFFLWPLFWRSTMQFYEPDKKIKERLLYTSNWFKPSLLEAPSYWSTCIGLVTRVNYTSGSQPFFCHGSLKAAFFNWCVCHSIKTGLHHLSHD